MLDAYNYTSLKYVWVSPVILILCKSHQHLRSVFTQHMRPCQLKWNWLGSVDAWTWELCTIGMIELRRWSINEQHLMTTRIIAVHCNYPSTSVCVWEQKRPQCSTHTAKLKRIPSSKTFFLYSLTLFSFHVSRSEGGVSGHQH